MGDDEIFDEELPIMVLVDEDGAEHHFELLAELEIENNTYKVLLPLLDEDTEIDEDEVEIFFFKVLLDEEGNEFLSDIEDDEEWEMVADAWKELEEEEEEL
ncbi:MAG TPA: DUF1292 domain-containing protein [Syntrophomonadaceae bacterium]|nr:DUF1292 domain-containing protein [Syntrophomonadaceae bacterium]